MLIVYLFPRLYKQKKDKIILSWNRQVQLCEDEGESVKEKMSNFLCPKTIVVKSDNHNAKPMNTKKHLVDAY